MIRHARWTAFIVAISIATAALGVAGGPASASVTPGQLGGMDVAGYCLGLGYTGTPVLGQATLLLGSTTGPNGAYGNWACVAGSGATTPVAVGGTTPSFADLCAVQYLGVASYPLPTDANDAYTWNCYLLPPATGSGLAAQVRAATDALLQTALVQDEISQLRALVAARKLLPAVQAGVTFLRSHAVQEAIADVLAGYKLPNQSAAVTTLLAAAMTRAVLS